MRRVPPAPWPAGSASPAFRKGRVSRTPAPPRQAASGGTRRLTSNFLERRAPAMEHPRAEPVRPKLFDALGVSG